jgi:hypothetical protein
MLADVTHQFVLAITSELGKAIALVIVTSAGTWVALYKKFKNKTRVVHCEMHDSINRAVEAFQNIIPKIDKMYNSHEAIMLLLEEQNSERDNILEYQQICNNVRHQISDKSVAEKVITGIKDLEATMFEIDKDMHALGHHEYTDQEVENYIQRLQNSYFCIIREAKETIAPVRERIDCANNITSEIYKKFIEYLGEVRAMFFDPRNNKINRLHSLTFNFMRKSVSVTEYTLQVEERLKESRRLGIYV